MMKHYERIAELRTWERQYHAMKAMLNNIESVFGDIDYESGPFKAVLDLFDSYTASVAKLVGDPDNSTLEWYYKENKMGAAEMKALVPKWKRSKAIKNIERLCEFIEAQMEDACTSK
jgi:hypothetical protein